MAYCAHGRPAENCIIHSRPAPVAPVAPPAWPGHTRFAFTVRKLGRARHAVPVKAPVAAVALANRAFAEGRCQAPGANHDGPIKLSGIGWPITLCRHHRKISGRR